ncbi:ATP-binding protein [Synoicihabitans lomoniglobus]|uniref:histidine kinase n=1 Tax=Synoicihabitans lomoniglobus TaxID=2909285 RepID=A0AAF0CQP2_9BACT|nr:PAS domain S-box protein [Opitutaceae bacterium LMO-M01]WED66263.1 PAS domain S-box protein [Opitutaceae bacterium LMO-M01]
MNHLNTPPPGPEEGSVPPFPSSLQRYQSIVENAVEGIFQSTSDGRFLLANPALARLYGYESPSALVDGVENISSNIYADPAVREEFMRLMDLRGEVRGMEYQVLRKDGEVIWISEHARAVRDDRGRLLYYEGFIEDITERKRIEEQLRQAQKMDAIGRLAGGVAHDFNNILTAIIGYSEILMATLPDPRSRSHAECIVDGSQRAAALCRQLLILSRRHAVLPRSLDLNHVVRDMQKLLERLMDANITLVTRLDEQEMVVRADSTQMEQVILNLAVNARDAMPQGGTLTISTRALTLPDATVVGTLGMPEGTYVEVAVEDTGTGMSPEVQSQLFEPFFTTKSEGKGTGLGLATCYSIVHQNRGQIMVGSKEGAGTTVRFFLPTSYESPGRTGATDPGVRPTGNETVLLAEDDPTVRNLVRINLEDLGYTVLTAEDGAHALELAKAHGCRRIQILVTDVMMPRMDGKELAYWLRLVSPETRVLFMSGYTDRSIISATTLQRGVGFVQKPFGPNALARRVRSALDAGSDRSSVDLDASVG